MRARIAAAAAAAALTIADAAALGALAQSGPRSLPAATGTSIAFPGLPRYVNGFQRWLRLNSKPIPPRSSDPHFGVKNVYVNRSRAQLTSGGKQRYPYSKGTIVVKAAKRPGAKFVSLVAIMRKVPGFDPARNDWQYAEYTRSSASGRFTFVGEGAVCYSCHGLAKKQDYVYTKLG